MAAGIISSRQAATTCRATGSRSACPRSRPSCSMPGSSSTRSRWSSHAPGPSCVTSCDRRGRHRRWTRLLVRCAEACLPPHPVTRGRRGCRPRAWRFSSSGAGSPQARAITASRRSRARLALPFIHLPAWAVDTSRGTSSSGGQTRYEPLRKGALQPVFSQTRVPMRSRVPRGSVRRGIERRESVCSQGGKAPQPAHDR
jgi:hypothetical protein